MWVSSDYGVLIAHKLSWVHWLYYSMKDAPYIVLMFGSVWVHKLGSAISIGYVSLILFWRLCFLEYAVFSLTFRYWDGAFHCVHVTISVHAHITQRGHHQLCQFLFIVELFFFGICNFSLIFEFCEGASSLVLIFNYLEHGHPVRWISARKLLRYILLFESSWYGQQWVMWHSLLQLLCTSLICNDLIWKHIPNIHIIFYTIFCRQFSSIDNVLRNLDSAITNLSKY